MLVFDDHISTQFGSIQWVMSLIEDFDRHSCLNTERGAHALVITIKESHWLTP